MQVGKIYHSAFYSVWDKRGVLKSLHS